MTSQVIAVTQPTMLLFAQVKENGAMVRREVLAGLLASAGTAMLPNVARTANEPLRCVAAVQECDVRAADRHDAELRFAKLPAGEVAYVDRGEGPAALFLHGFPLSSFQWRDVIELSSGRRRCVAADFLGLGRSRVAAGQAVTPDAQVAMLVSLMDYLRIAIADVVANDSGGAVAQLLAVTHPQRVRTLLLTNCDVEPDSPPPALLPVIELARKGTYADERLVPWVNAPDLARSANGLGGLCYSKPGYPSNAAIQQYLAPLVQSPQRKALVNRYTIGLSPNPLAGIEAKLRHCRAPTRVVWGMADTIFNTSNPDYLSALLPEFRGIRRVSSGKLFFPEEYPEIVASEAWTLWSDERRQR